MRHILDTHGACGIPWTHTVHALETHGLCSGDIQDMVSSVGSNPCWSNTKHWPAHKCSFTVPYAEWGYLVHEHALWRRGDPTCHMYSGGVAPWAGHKQHALQYSSAERGRGCSKGRDNIRGRSNCTHLPYRCLPSLTRAPMPRFLRFEHRPDHKTPMRLGCAALKHGPPLTKRLGYTHMGVDVVLVY